MSMSISQILQPEQHNEKSKNKVHSKVKVFYTFKGSDTHCFCAFDFDLSDDIRNRKWVGIPLKQCVTTVCSSSPDQIADNYTAVYSANFEESLTVENWSPLHDSQTKIIWEGHGVLTDILNDNEKHAVVTGKVVPTDQFSPYDCYIEVLLQLHPIRYKPLHSNSTLTGNCTQSYLPPVRSLWSNKIITTNDYSFAQSSTSYPTASAIVERPFITALYHLSHPHPSLQPSQHQHQQTIEEHVDSQSSISLSPLKTENTVSKEIDQQRSPPYNSIQSDTQTSSSSYHTWFGDANNRQLSSPTRPSANSAQSYDKRRRLSPPVREQSQHNQHQSLASFPYQQHYQHQQQQSISFTTVNSAQESGDCSNKQTNSNTSSSTKLHHHHRRYPSSISTSVKHEHQASLSTPTPTIIRNLSPSNNTLVKPGVDTFYHQSRRKKRDTKPPNANDIRPFVEIERRPNGTYVLPAEVDSWTVLDLGTVVWDKAAFHNQRYIYPVGYRVKKWYRSMVDPHSDTQYTCEILDGGDEPIFQLHADDNPTECWRGPTPTTVWTIAVRRAFAIRNMDYGHNPVGPDFFGLRKNTIAKMIQDLPNADKCKNYIWQNFEVMSSAKGKAARRTTAITTTNSSLRLNNISNNGSNRSTCSKSDTPTTPLGAAGTVPNKASAEMLSMRQQRDVDDNMILCSPNTSSIQ